MGKVYLSYIETSEIYVCGYCGVHLSCKADRISKDFWAGTGRAYLYDKVHNTRIGEPQERMLRTGLHCVRDLFCLNCASKLGWKYDWALEYNQKYKEGKFILERNLISKAEWKS